MEADGPSCFRGAPSIMFSQIHSAASGQATEDQPPLQLPLALLRLPTSSLPSDPLENLPPPPQAQAPALRLTPPTKGQGPWPSLTTLGANRRTSFSLARSLQPSSHWPPPLLIASLKPIFQLFEAVC
eukprot:3932951-Rhodomonas_salina.3